MRAWVEILELWGWTRFVVAHRILVIAVFAIVTAALCAGLPRLRLETSIYDLAIEDLPEKKAYDAFKERFGSEEIIVVVVHDVDVFNPRVFEKIRNLSECLSKVPGVRRVLSLPHIKDRMDVTKKWDLARYRQVVRQVSLFTRNIVSPDERHTAITLVLEAGPPRARILAEVRSVMAGEGKGLPLYDTGLPSVSDALVRATERDFIWLPPLTFLLMAVALAVVFRRAGFVLLPVASLLLVLLWTFGAMAWAGVPLSMLTMIVPVFLVAVGTAYGLHVLSEHKVSVEKTPGAGEAARLTYARMGFPVSLAVITTGIGVASLLVNKMEGIRQFSLASCFGLLGLFAVMLVLWPAVLSLLPRGAFLPKARDGDVPGLAARFLEKVLGAVMREEKSTLRIICALSILAGVGLFRLEVETNPVDYFKERSDVARNIRHIKEHLAGPFPVNVIMDGKEEDFFENPANVARIAALQDFLGTLEGVDTTVSLADYLRLVNYATNRYKEKFYRLPAEGFELRILMNNLKSLLGQDVFDQFMTADLSSANVLLRTSISSSTDFLKLKEKILHHVADATYGGADIRVTGLGPVIAESSHLLTRGQVKSLALTLALIFVVMFLLFMSAKVGLVALVPNLFPILVCFGFMGWFGVEISVATVLVACVAIGLAVDDTIHYLFRYNREFRLDPDRRRAVRRALLGVGRPIVFTTLTISLGFCVLLFSSFKPTITFGALMVLTMVSALVGDLVVLPALMRRVELVTVWDLLKSMSTVDRMTGDLIHELNQPLNAIKMGSEFIRMCVEEREGDGGEELARVAREISTQADRAAEIVWRIREFETRPGVETERVDINGPIRSVVDIMAHQLRVDDIRLDLDLAHDLPPVLAHEDRLKQVFYNLLTNARESIDRKRRGPRPPEAHRIRIATSMDGDRVVVSITDTGEGIPKRDRERIFDPFYTTKPHGRGKGLGLSISRGIVREYGGRVLVRSEPGRGAIFRLTFPRAPF